MHPRRPRSAGRRAPHRRPSSPAHRGLLPGLRLALLLCAVAAGVAAVACHLPRVGLFFGGESQMRVAISPDLNRAAPVAVDVLVAYDQSVLLQLEQYTARQWFAQREQFLRDHQGPQRQFDSWEWEWVPGQLVSAIPLSYKVGSRGGVIFASYASDGAHRQTFDPQRDVILTLGASDFTVSQP